MSANYSFLDSGGSKGVLTSLEDGENVISFLEQKRKLLNLKDKGVVLSGVSAGLEFPFGTDSKITNMKVFQAF